MACLQLAKTDAVSPVHPAANRLSRWSQTRLHFSAALHYTINHHTVPPMVTRRAMVTWWRLRRAHIEMAAVAERGGNRARGERREVIVHQHFSCQ
jgi:hypothetical protein